MFKRRYFAQYNPTGTVANSGQPELLQVVIFDSQAARNAFVELEGRDNLSVKAITGRAARRIAKKTANDYMKVLTPSMDDAFIKRNLQNKREWYVKNSSFI